MDILSLEDFQTIERNAERLLSQVGIEVGDVPLMQEVWGGEYGVRFTGNRVFLPEGLASGMVKRYAQPTFTQLGRTEQNDIVLGGGCPIATPAYGPPYIRLQGQRRRLGTLADFKSILSLIEAEPALGHAGGLIGDLDAEDASTRHLLQTVTMLANCAKPILGPAPNAAAYRDALELAKIIRPPQPNAVHLLNMVNANSPLRYRKGMLRALLETARLDQGLLLTSYCLPGLTAPVTPVGALTQGLAEILFGTACSYRVNPRSKIIAGIIPIPFSMQSMRPTYGQPSTLISAFAAAQLVRRLGLPCRIDSGPSSGKICDAQAGYESGFGLGVALHNKADFIVHAAGWLDNGLLFDEEKFHADCQHLRSLLPITPASPSPTIDSVTMREMENFVQTRRQKIQNSAELAAQYSHVEG